MVRAMDVVVAVDRRRLGVAMAAIANVGGLRFMGALCNEFVNSCKRGSIRYVITSGEE